MKRRRLLLFAALGLGVILLAWVLEGRGRPPAVPSPRPRPTRPYILTTHPIPLSEFDAEYEWLRGAASTALPAKDVARTLWTAPDIELVDYVDKWPADVYAEAIRRQRADTLPVFVALADRPGVQQAALQAIARLHKQGSEHATIALCRFLESKEYGERALSAVLLAKEAGVPLPQRSRVVSRLREIIASDRDKRHLLVASQALARIDGKAALPYVRRAHVKATGAQPGTTSEKRTWFAFVLVRGALGDRSVLPSLRRYAIQVSDPHLAAQAVDVLGGQFGVSERASLERAAHGTATARLQAAQWLAHWGDRRSVLALRLAASKPPPDIKNSGGFAHYNSELLACENAIARGHKSPAPKAMPVRWDIGTWSTPP